MHFLVGETGYPCFWRGKSNLCAHEGENKKVLCSRSKKRRLSFCYNPIGQHKTQTNPSQSMTVDMHIRAHDFDSQWWLNALESQPINNHQWPCFHVEGIWYRVWNSPSLWIPSRLYIRSPYALVIETNLAQWFPMHSTLGCLALEERSVSDTDWWPLPSSKRDFYYFCRKGWESDWRGKGWGSSYHRWKWTPEREKKGYFILMLIGNSCRKHEH